MTLEALSTLSEPDLSSYKKTVHKQADFNVNLNCHDTESSTWCIHKYNINVATGANWQNVELGWCFYCTICILLVFSFKYINHFIPFINIKYVKKGFILTFVPFTDKSDRRIFTNHLPVLSYQQQTMV